MIGVDVEGLETVLGLLTLTPLRAEAAAGLAMLEIAQIVHRVAVEEISAHQMSAPGTPPGERTGELVAGIASALIGAGVAEVRSAAAYSLHLELGTRKMQARPFMHPALRVGLAAARGIVRARLAPAMKG